MLSGGRRTVVIAALGVTQILAWGSSYYLLAVLAQPIAAETGWPLSLVVGGLSLGLLAGGLVSPRVGRTIEARGGRPVLAASSALLGGGLLLLAAAHHWMLYVAAWLVIGLGMGTGLYDAAFAALGHAYRAQARSAITALTLWAGFASTVCWPISAFLVQYFGWRGACLTYAGLQFGLSLPLHLLLMPRAQARHSPPPPNAAAPSRSPAQRRALMLLAVLTTSAGAVAALVSVHLLNLLQSCGVSFAAAVALGALIGPAQVGARVVEMALGQRHHPFWTLAAAMSLSAAGLIVLASGIGVPALALVLYGGGNGVWSIARGTFPLAVFGPVGYTTLIGRLGLANLWAQALSPPLAALLLEQVGSGAVLVVIAAMAGFNLGVAIALFIAVRPALVAPGRG